VCLNITLSPNFGFGPCTIFCLVLVPALYKTFGFSPSVKYLLKKTKTNGLLCGPIMACHVAHQKTKILIIILFIIFNLKISLVPALSTFFYISPCTLLLVPEFFIFYFKKTFNEIIMFYYCFIHYFY